LRSGVDINTVRRIFRYPTTIVTTETLAKLADVLEVDASELIESVPDDVDNKGGNQVKLYRGSP
jgi:DNA-binding Xre family transcriptional regulator